MSLDCSALIVTSPWLSEDPRLEPSLIDSRRPDSPTLLSLVRDLQNAENGRLS